jgi:diguanylate cyclase (GGDEF)-like protein
VRDQSLTKLASRSAAAFLVAWGVQMLLGAFLPFMNGSGMTSTQAVRWGLVTAAMGVGTFVLPWSRWRPVATLAIGIAIVPLIALVAWDTGFAAGKDTPSPDAAFFVILAWVGVTQPRWYPTAFAPYIGLVYGGVLLTTPGTRESAYSMPTVVLMAAMLGEVIAWMRETVTKAQLIERRRLNDVQTLTSTLSRLRGVPIEDAAESIGLAAGDLYRCETATVVLRGIDIDPALTTYRTGGRVSHDEAASLLDTATTDPDDRVRVTPRAGDPRAGVQLVISLLTPGEELAGIVIADLVDEPDSFTMHVARLFSTEVGTAIEQLEQVEALEQKALFDELTGIGNRRRASELLSSLGAGDSVMLLDVDDFKQVNDTDGHAGGDDVLKALARHLRTSVADADGVARYGGDEFIVLIPRSAGDPLAVARGIHASWIAGQPRTTVSVGVARHDAASSPASTLEHADMALYESKQGGRNQVRLYGSPDALAADALRLDATAADDLS